MSPSKSNPSNIVVVDGSNIATEGRSTPSLRQLDEAVRAFRDEFPDAVVTVVVDATFGHRIDKKETAEFDEAVANNEVVAPPAGAIGRGDAFVLSIANKVGARVLSNDSFQEFHGDYPWLFDEGRLVGGKPVPYIGWVFVERLPVKGPTSRKAQRAARRPAEPQTVRRTASKAASQPMPVPTAPPPGARRAAKAPAAPAPTTAAPPLAPAPTAGSSVNDVLPFLDFVEHHPVGSSVNGVVESYSSHGAYVSVGDVRGYVPLRLMGNPPPRSAREVMRVGDAVTLVVTSYAPARRSVDMAMPDMAPVADLVPAPELEELAETVTARISPEPARKAATRKAAAAKKTALPKKAATAKKAAAKTVAPAKKAAPANKAAPVRKTAAAPKTTATKKTAPAKKTPAKKTTAKKTTTKRTAATKVAAASAQEV
jgi:hypothetical protein